MSQSTGQKLKEIRESMGISLEEIAQKTRIRLHYLKAIEMNDEDAPLSAAQLRGFLRLYTSVLGINLAELHVEGYLENKQPVLKPKDEERERPVDDEDPSENQVSEKEIQVEGGEQEGGETQEEKRPDNPILLPEDVFQIRETEKYQHSTAIFKAVGAKLEARRKLLSLSFEDIVKNLHIRQLFLEALETGKLEILPSPVQARGMLANYAEFLNLDVDAILLEYAEGLQVKRLERQEAQPTEDKETAKELSPMTLKIKNFFSLDLVVMSVLFLSFAFFVVWGVNRILRADNPNQTATDIPEVADVLLATGSPTPITSTPDETGMVENASETGQDEPTPIFTPFPNDNPINLVIIPRQQTWVQITEDGEVAFVGRLLAGNAYDYSGDNSVEVLTGNAGALQIYFNDQDIGSPGFTGEVVNLIFTESGLVQPTPTNTPTITETPRATPSATVTPTPTQTRMPTLTPTDEND